ncbi:MAG: M48 family metallopeptidase [Aestuariivirga sp.]
METEGSLFDGRNAAELPVTVSLDGTSLLITGSGVRKSWPLRRVSAVAAHVPGHPLRLKRSGWDGSRLTLHDPFFVNHLLRQSPHLRKPVHNRWTQAALWVGGVAAAITVIAHLTLNFAPQRLAYLLPEKFRDDLGQRVEASLVEGARQCESPAGLKALEALATALRQNAEDIPDFTVRVYDIGIMNAFAVPGGRIIMTRELLQRAARPSEVAGVLAHELGHVYHRHSEAQLVRLVGLQILISALTGTSGGDGVTSAASLAAILRLSRDAERQADEFANQGLNQTSIGTAGLKAFFKTVQSEEGESTGAFWKRFGDMMSTHPVTQDRIDSLTALPEGKEAQAILTDKEWSDLRKICSG